jgi:hypothetical protein
MVGRPGNMRCGRRRHRRGLRHGPTAARPLVNSAPARLLILATASQRRPKRSSEPRSAQPVDAGSRTVATSRGEVMTPLGAAGQRVEVEAGPGEAQRKPRARRGRKGSGRWGKDGRGCLTNAAVRLEFPAIGRERTGRRAYRRRSSSTTDTRLSRWSVRSAASTVLAFWRPIRFATTDNNWSSRSLQRRSAWSAISAAGRLVRSASLTTEAVHPSQASRAGTA